MSEPKEMPRDRAAVPIHERLIGGSLTILLLVCLVAIAVRNGVDVPFGLGVLAGLVIGLVWRPARRAAEGAVHPVAFGERRGALARAARVVAFFVPPLSSPLVALLLVFVHPAGGLAAFFVACGETGVRMAMGVDGVRRWARRGSTR